MSISSLLSRCGLALLGIVLLVPAAAAEKPSFSVRGAGLLDCAAFTDVRAHNEEAYAMVGGWIDGYLTAVNRYESDTYDITSFESTELIVKILANHCADNPEHRLFPVLSSVVERLRDSRIRAPAAIVGVRQGAQQATLYQPTLVRVQERLIDSGYLSGGASGEFDDATRQALMAYQQSLAYNPTGFPDQGTLWHLFSD